MIHVSQADTENNKTPWIKEMEQLGIVTPPKKKGFPPEFLTRERVILAREKEKPAVLNAWRKRGRLEDDILRFIGHRSVAGGGRRMRGSS